MKKQTHREPTLYIVGNPERADEIRHIIGTKLGGDIDTAYKYDNSQKAYYVNVFGFVDCCHIDSCAFKNAVANGWMQELKLPDSPKFKPSHQRPEDLCDGSDIVSEWQEEIDEEELDEFAKDYISENSIPYKSLLKIGEQVEAYYRKAKRGGDHE